MTSENCTYFDSSATPSAGACRAKICKLNSNICQIRLDFNSFVITGPSTSSLTGLGEYVGGTEGSGGKALAVASQCQTDTFSVTNQHSFPIICGTNTGYHAYFEAADECNSLDFQLGSAAFGVTSVATRSWSIKITQLSCDFENLPPIGCTQWYYGSTTSTVYSYNWDGDLHLANQNQAICVRREAGYCKICWSQSASTDFSVSGNAAKGLTTCCSYGDDGLKAGATMGWDCVMIPGAIKKSDSAQKPEKLCGQSHLVTAAGTTTATVCCKF